MDDSLTYTWDQYKKWIADLVAGNGTFYCRGQSNHEWPLQTTFHRIADKRITLEQYLNVIIPEIHYHICATQNEILDLTKEAEFGAFLGLLQHHGFPTPLLDWTISPYIAAYFAFRDVKDNEPQSDYVKVFVFDHKLWTASFQQPLNLREMQIRYVSVIRPYARFNPRVIPQQSAFTVTNVSDMEAYIRECEKFSGKRFLYKIIIDVHEKTQIMRDLHLMGINEMTLFPTIDGICRALASQFFSPDTIGLTPSQLQILLEEIRTTANKTKIA
jgi:hypothetical protein